MFWVGSWWPPATASPRLRCSATSRSGGGRLGSASIIPHQFSPRVLQAFGLAGLLGAGVLAASRAGAIIHYAGTYTTTVAASLVISAMAAGLLVLFSFTASD